LDTKDCAAAQCCVLEGVYWRNQPLNIFSLFASI
jgi:hypothetical protein